MDDGNPVPSVELIGTNDVKIDWDNINKKATFKNMKVSAAFHGYLSLNKQKKIPKILKMMQFPCSDALSYAHFCEGRLDVVIQCMNKIWDIHPLIPIIKASGGIASTWHNESATKAGNVLISANKNIHIKMLRLCLLYTSPSPRD